MTRPVFTLTPVQKQLLDYIGGYITEHRGVAPTMQQMAAGMGLRSKGNVHRMLGTLAERGYIRRLPHAARALQIVHRAHNCPSCDGEVAPAFSFCPDCGYALRQQARAA